jgi:hypothetical protein
MCLLVVYGMASILDQSGAKVLKDYAAATLFIQHHSSLHGTRRKLPHRFHRFFLAHFPENRVRALGDSDFAIKHIR